MAPLAEKSLSLLEVSGLFNQNRPTVGQVHREGSDGIYGSPWVHRELRREGIRVGEKRVARLMQQYEMRGRCSRLYKPVPKGTKEYYSKHPNRLLEAVQKWLGSKGMIASMNRPGKCTDNGAMESFFHSLKAEKLTGNTWKTYSGLKSALKQYIDSFYNRTRLHSGLGYMSPLEYEAING
nr:IS3 family transposase [Oceanobacter mangrovi]